MPKWTDLPQAKSLTQEQLQQLIAAANQLGMSPEELMTQIGYETGGTYSPEVVGGTGDAFRGLAQAGAAAIKDHPNLGGDFGQQLMGLVDYLKAKNYKPGEYMAGEAPYYSYAAINAGKADKSRFGWKTGGKGPTVAQRVEDMMSGPYNQQAKGLLAQYRPTEPNREPAAMPDIAAREPPDTPGVPAPPNIMPATTVPDPADKQGDAGGILKMMQQAYQEANKPQRTIGSALAQAAGMNRKDSPDYDPHMTLLGGVLGLAGVPTGKEKQRSNLVEKADKLDKGHLGPMEANLRASQPSNLGFSLADLFGEKKKRTLGQAVGNGIASMFG